MRRGLGCLLALTLLVGGAACSDDDGGDKGAASDESDRPTTTTPEREPSNTGNAVIDEYCDTVQELVDKAARLEDDPTNTELQDEIRYISAVLNDQSAEVAAEAEELNAEEAARFESCATDLSVIGD